MAVNEKVAIKVKGYDHKLVDLAAAKIVEAAKRNGATVSGPIPLPTEKEIVTILRAVHKYKDSREQFEQRTHKRLIQIVKPTEKVVNWDYMSDKIRNAGREINVLNLFAYTGGATLACAEAGANVCHVDASKGMVQWARENAAASGLSDKPVRWIVDDCEKFIGREIRRGRKYDAVIMDPPSYGRGPCRNSSLTRKTFCRICKS